MNVVLWIVQGILAAVFLMGGVMKATQPGEKLLKQLPWVEDFSTGTVRSWGRFGPTVLNPQPQHLLLTTTTTRRF